MFHNIIILLQYFWSIKCSLGETKPKLLNDIIIIMLQ